MSDKIKDVPGYVTIAPGEVEHYIRVGNQLRSEAIGAFLRSVFTSRRAKADPARPLATASHPKDIRTKVLHGFTSSLAAIRSAGEVLRDERNLTDLDRARFTQIILNEEARLESLLPQLRGPQGRDSTA